MNSVVLGFGGAVPKKCIKNDALSETLDTSDEWIVKRTGIRQRFIAEEETTVSLAISAALDAINSSKISPEKIDLIIVGTVTPDKTFPSTACLVQKALNIRNAVAFDVSAACSGFIYALDIADNYIKLNKSKCALVIGAETFSKIVDWSDRSTCVLFGDGAGAAILEAQESDKGIIYSKISSDGNFADMLMTSGGVSTTQSSGTVIMNGKSVFKFAVEKFVKSLEELLENNNITLNDIDLIIPHQANSRIIDMLIEISGIDREKVVVVVDKFANTSAASIPLALNSIKDCIFSKKNIVLLAMGAGFTWGASLIKL